MPIKIAIVTVSLDMTIHIRHRASGTRRRVVFQSRVCFSRTLEILKKNAGIPDFQLEIQLSGGGRQNVTFRCVPLSQNSLPDPPVARGGASTKHHYLLCFVGVPPPKLQNHKCQ